MTKTQAQKIWDADVKYTAECYYREFQEINLDGEWSGTGYSEVSREVIEILEKDWSDYHYEIQCALNEIDSEIGIDVCESETSNFAGGVFAI